MTDSRYTTVARKINRRSILSGLAASTVAASIPAAAAPAAEDADLLRLHREYRAACKIMKVAGRKFDAAEDRYSELKPPKPEEIKCSQEAEEAFLNLTVREMWEGDHPAFHAFHASGRQHRRALEAWNVDCDRIEAECGIQAADLDYQEQIAKAGRIANKLLSTPAVTLAGILIKIRVHKEWTFEDRAFVAAIGADIKRMAGAVA